MGCERCGFTGIAEEYEPEAGFVDIPCPHCHGVDGEEPDLVREGHDALIEMEKEAYTFASGVGIMILEADASPGHSTKQGFVATIQAEIDAAWRQHAEEGQT